MWQTPFNSILVTELEKQHPQCSAVDGAGTPHLVCLRGRTEEIQHGTASLFHRAARFVLPHLIKKEL